MKTGAKWYPSAQNFLRTFFVAFFFFTMLPTAFAEDACDKAIPDNIKGQVTLPANCKYHSTISITESDTTLDCNGSVFNGGGKGKAGLSIDSEGKTLANVTVRNCVFKNFKAGVLITWSEVDTKKKGNKQELYSRSPNKIVLDHLMVEDNDGVGIFIDDYVVDVTVKNSVVRNNAGVGLYLQHSTKENKIINNNFSHNGIRKDKSPREAIAVDSSANNLIENNKFQSNGAGSIFLYKNCGEHIDNGKQVLRWQHSDNNIIRKNEIKNEKVGIWVASRQSMNLGKWGCGDNPMEPSGTYFQDYADNNLIAQNIFIKNKVAVRVEGDYNEVVNNIFECGNKVMIDFPRTKREEFLERSQVGSKVEKNEEIGCTK